jgi:adenylate cyclase
VFSLNGLVLGKPFRHDLGTGETIAGRSPSSQIVLGPPSVSRRHAKFRVERDRCFVTDLGSRCGTFVGGGRISVETEVVAGDRIRLGEVALTLAHTDPKIQFEERPADATVVRKVGERSSIHANQEVMTAERVLAIFAEVGRMLLSVRPLPEVLGRLADLTFEVLPNERVFLLLADPAAPEGLRASAMRSRDKSVPQGVTLSRTVLQQVVTERIAMLATDVPSDARLESSMSLVQQAVRSFMCAPLLIHEKVEGVLYVDSQRHTFTAADLDAFTALATYASIGIEQARLSEQLLRESRRRERLQRYHSQSVIERILTAGDEADTQFLAQEREVTILFCDIVSFTTLCENLAPNDIVSLLNGFFSRMSDVIFEHEGTLDKYIGDELMVVYNAPIEQPDHAARAARTALGMRRALAAFNEESPVIPLEVRISMASGRAMVGDIGTTRRREFTVLGDVVNTASRIKGNAHPGQIVLSGVTARQLPSELRTERVGMVQVRGRIADVEVFRLMEAPADASRDESR